MFPAYSSRGSRARIVACALSLGLAPLAQSGDSDKPVEAAAERTVEAPRVTIDLVDSDVRDALQLVSKQAGVDIIAAMGVEGRISLSLQDATLEETLDAIASVGGFEVHRAGEIITLQTLEARMEHERRRAELAAVLTPPDQEVIVPLQPLVLRLKYVDAERVEGIVASMLSERGSVSLLKTQDHVEIERGVPDSGGMSSGSLQIGTQLSSSSAGQPASSHTLVVFDEQQRLDQIEEVVQALDVKPMQVVIEARFVEISLGNDERLGIDWNAVASMAGGATPTTLPFGNGSLGEFDPNEPTGGPSVFPPAPNSVTAPGAPGLFTFGTLDFTSFTAMLELIRRDSNVQLVSNPRIVVGDRHTATILVGERYPILSANVSEFGTVTEQLDRYEPIGIQLAVTPAVLGDEVEMLVRPSTSSLGPDVEGSTGLVVARINSRQIDTLVRVRNGQTVVVGGLITSREQELETSVPFLGSLPLLGNLFRHTSKVSERVDLVVFLTVTIVEDNGLTPEQQQLFEDTRLTEEHALRARKRRSVLDFSPAPPLF